MFCCKSRQECVAFVVFKFWFILLLYNSLLSFREFLEEKRQQEETLLDEIGKAKSRMSEVNEELNRIMSDLQNAGIDNHEGKRELKRAEVLEHLKRLYPDSVVTRRSKAEVLGLFFWGKGSFSG